MSVSESSMVADPSAARSPRPLTFKRWLVISRSWISILLLLPVSLLVMLSPPRFPLPGWGTLAFDTLGWSLFLAGGAMRWWATLYIGGRKTVELVTDGPYSITRNPIYLGTLLLTLSVGAFLQSLTFLGTVLLVAVPYLLITVSDEEEDLGQRHSAAFVEYRRTVPALLPNFFLFHSRPVIELQTSGLKRELIRSCRWVWIPMLCDLAIHFRAETWWPTLLTLP